MCFLYRQSISIVYESKFKYIYRYFIKIDRCFCGILQSLPLRKCGLKFQYPRMNHHSYSSLPLRKCGLKSLSQAKRQMEAESLPLRKCGLKLPCLTSLCSFFLSLPLRKCGLKSKASGISILSTAVTSLAEVWIEIVRK